MCSRFVTAIFLCSASILSRGSPPDVCAQEYVDGIAGFDALSFSDHWRFRSGSDHALPRLRYTLATSSDSWKFQHSCSRKGHRYFELIFKFSVNSSITKRFLARRGYPVPHLSEAEHIFVFFGICAPFVCEDSDFVPSIWPRYASRLAPLRRSPLRRLAPLRFPLRLIGNRFWFGQTTSLHRGFVRVAAHPPTLNADSVVLPAFVPLLSSDPASVLSTLYKSAAPLNVSQLRLDFGFMPELGEGGMLALPDRVTSVVVDVGANALTEFAGLVAGDPRVLAICFEPLPSAYLKHRSWLASQPADVARRIWLFPVAIGPEVGLVGLQTTAFGECSSLLTINVDAMIVPQFSECTNVVGVNVVVQMPLGMVLSRLPIDVAMLKVDAQGMDFDVVLSAGAHISKVREIQLEVFDVEPKHATLRYVGQLVKSEVVGGLSELGFALKNCTLNAPELQEEDCVFSRETHVP